MHERGALPQLIWLRRTDTVSVLVQRAIEIKRITVFTDLDGCLLNHDDYRWDAATSRIRSLQADGIPLIFASSKTAAEIGHLQRAIGVDDPFVAENGGAVGVPHGWLSAASGREVRTLVTGRVQVLDALAALHDEFSFTSFDRLGVEGVASLTGLDIDSAARACDRHCTEPVHWRDTQDQLLEFSRRLGLQGFSVSRGGRFVHVSAPSNKADGVRWLKEQMIHTDREPGTTIAVGDSDIDLAMLEQADIAVVQPQPDGEFSINPNNEVVVRAEQSGSSGWASAVAQAVSTAGSLTRLNQK